MILSQHILASLVCLQILCFLATLINAAPLYLPIKLGSSETVEQPRDPWNFYHPDDNGGKSAPNGEWSGSQPASTPATYTFPDNINASTISANIGNGDPLENAEKVKSYRHFKNFIGV
ncbi:hypothetical protein BDF22DRAFT_742498 [Syncephalis plumigaleata]|nr:hypothetical protein BDF22DRAFT_742498 [Syncephalis plumigaleata]